MPRHMLILDVISRLFRCFIATLFSLMPPFTLMLLMICCHAAPCCRRLLADIIYAYASLFSIRRHICRWYIIVSLFTLWCFLFSLLMSFFAAFIRLILMFLRHISFSHFSFAFFSPDAAFISFHADDIYHYYLLLLLPLFSMPLFIIILFMPLSCHFADASFSHYFHSLIISFSFIFQACHCFHLFFFLIITLYWFSRAFIIFLFIMPALIFTLIAPFSSLSFSDAAFIFLSSFFSSFRHDTLPLPLSPLILSFRHYAVSSFRLFSWLHYTFRCLFLCRLRLSRYYWYAVWWHAISIILMLLIIFAGDIDDARCWLFRLSLIIDIAAFHFIFSRCFSPFLDIFATFFFFHWLLSLCYVFAIFHYFLWLHSFITPLCRHWLLRFHVDVYYLLAPMPMPFSIFFFADISPFIYFSDAAIDFHWWCWLFRWWFHFFLPC